MAATVTHLFSPTLADEANDDLAADVESPREGVRAAAAARLDLTLDMVEQLALDASAAVRRAIAANPLVTHSREAMRYLANDRSAEVVSALSANRLVPRAYFESAMRFHPALYAGRAATALR